MTKRMTLSQELSWRGFVNQTTLKDIARLDASKRNFYMGFDSLSLRGAIFNSRNDNFILTTLLGANLNFKRKINFNLSSGVEHAQVPPTLIQQTKFLKTSPVSELGIAYYLSKNNNK